MNQKQRKELEDLAEKLRQVFSEHIAPIAERVREIGEEEQEKVDAFMGTNLEQSERVMAMEEAAQNIETAADDIDLLEDDLDQAADEISQACETW